MGKIAVLGLGKSLDLFSPEGFETSIGVNDIWRKYECENIVCLNPPKDFVADRLNVINKSKPDKFFSQIVIWDSRPDFEKINILPGYPDRICRLDQPQYEKSFCSPFVAVQIAWKYFHSGEIHLFGVDIIDHPHLKGEVCRKIKIHFQNLKDALQKKNCFLIIHGNGILTELF
jgi:hypothetical protein